MYHRIQAYFAGIKPVWIDGTLYVLLALFGAVELTLNNDDIYKYVTDVRLVYWGKNIFAWLLAVTTAIKMFRSTSYADHVNDKAVEKALTDGPSTKTITSTESKTNEVKIEDSSIESTINK